MRSSCKAFSQLVINGAVGGQAHFSTKCELWSGNYGCADVLTYRPLGVYPRVLYLGHMLITISVF